jgi:hypothetical protein
LQGLHPIKQEKFMPQRISNSRIRVGAFQTIAEADQAIRRLLAAGFFTEQLLVICPAKFQDHFLPAAPQADTPSADAKDVLLKGGVVGATLGGIALTALALTGGGAIVAAALLIGGGAIAGGFGNLVVSKGYEEEADAYCKEAIEEGRIVVGVEVPGANSAGQLAEAERILNEAGATALKPV